MRILKKRTILKLAATFMLVGMMVGAFALHTKAAFAEPVDGCDSGSAVLGATTATGAPSCDVGVTTDPAIPVTGLSFTSVGNVVGGTAAVGTNDFTFAATVTDARNTNEGWQFQASSPGLSTPARPAIFLPVTIGNTGSTATCTPTVGNVSPTDCPDPTVASITLTSTPATFVTETPDGTSPTNPISGVANLSITGSYDVAVGTFPGTYTGAITLLLLNTFS